MPLTCPRCSTDLAPRDVDAPTGSVVIDECPACRGVFIDGDELMATCRTLAHLPERRTEVALTGARGAGIATCPRCGRVPHEIRIVDELVDFCTTCAGAWIDGGERAALGVDLAPRRRHHEGKGGAYREVVDQAASPDAIPCASCGVKVPIRSTFVSPAGFVCAPCQHRGELADGAAASRAASALTPTTSRVVVEALFMALAAVVEAIASAR